MALFSFSTKDEMADVICGIFRNHIAELNLLKEQINIAFSGGTTPELFFEKLAAKQKNPETEIDWSRIHIFWVDERCVPPDHQDSNYGMTRDHLLNALRLQKSQIHRIHGEDDPQKEAVRYENEIRLVFQEPEDIPVFDWIFLGMGEDGHTASIFPDRPDLLESHSLCAVSHYARSDQYRVTLTGLVIMHAHRISFLVTGANKSHIIRQIMRNEPDAKRYPAFHIKPVNGVMDWYLDASAANQLNL
jgi:6-phosphogluconolactonase